MTRVEVAIVKTADSRIFLERRGHRAQSCTCRKSSSNILALGEGYAGFARHDPYGAAFRFLPLADIDDVLTKCRRWVGSRRQRRRRRHLAKSFLSRF